MGIALREHKKIEKKQEKPISLGCNTMSVKKLLRVIMKECHGIRKQKP